MIGQLLAGHYRILQVLGAGGFGQTYITEDLHLPGHPQCVLKHLKPASTDPALLEIARKLFEKEAIVLQQLGNHDRIPRLLAYFEEEQEFYLVQEYVPGHPLSKELADSPKWSERQVIGLLQEVLAILVFIHGQGVIHRDIKPDNIMRRDLDGHLVLIDFGAIKQVRNQQVAHGQQTMTVAIGTPGYMPIEQASGNPRACSDIYSLGMLAIQALTGVNPYQLAEDERTGELQWEHLALASPQLIAILQRMTRYHFRERYLTAADALQAIDSLVSGVSPPAQTYVQTPPSQQPRRIESQTATVSVGGTATAPAPATSLPSQTPQRKASFLPLGVGILAISAAGASFFWFSSKVLNKQDFSAAVNSDLCRLAAPTDLPTTRVRSQPQRDASITANLARGTKVVFLSESGAFVNIQMANRATGWVYNNQITSCDAPVTTPKSTPRQAVTPTVTPKVTPKPIAIPVPSATPTATPTPTPTPIPIDVPTPNTTLSPAAPSTPSPAPTQTPYLSPRGIQPSPSASPVPTPTPIFTPTPTPTVSPSPSSSNPEPTKSPTEDKGPLF